MDLADFLDIKSSSVSGAKRRGVFPLEWAFKVAQGHNLSTDWLATGEGPMHREPQPKVAPLNNNHRQAAAPEPPEIDYEDDDEEEDEPDPEDLSPEQFWELWDEFLNEHPARAGWVQIELPKRFREFDEWLKKPGRMVRPAAPKRTKTVA